MNPFEVITAAFLMGTVGSLHCIGMCGPLALSLPMGNNKITGALVYNLGRVTTYAVLGLVLGFAGQALLNTRLQQWLSITLGAGILLFLLLPARFSKRRFAPSGAKPFLYLRKLLALLLQSPGGASNYLVGVLNGLLPCGLIYMALASAVITGTAFKGALFMVFFGLGTLPAMLVFLILGQRIKSDLRWRLRKAVPLFMGIMGLLLLLRGLNLGIPFISPALPDAGKTAAVGCH